MAGDCAHASAASEVWVSLSDPALVTLRPRRPNWLSVPSAVRLVGPSGQSVEARWTPPTLARPSTSRTWRRSRAATSDRRHPSICSRHGPGEQEAPHQDEQAE